MSPTHLSLLSNYFGAHSDWVWAGGGNLSEKTEDGLWIKASGVPLAEVTQSAGVVFVSSRQLRSLLSLLPTMTEMEFATQLDNLQLAVRPSMELLLHGLCPKKFVAHLHPKDLIPLLSNKRNEAQLLKLFPHAQIVDFAPPGPELARHMPANPVAKFYILRNHGIILQSDDKDEIVKLANGIQRKLDKFYKRTHPQDRTWKILNLFHEQNLPCAIITKPLTPLLAKIIRAYRPQTPDDVVYIGSRVYAWRNKPTYGVFKTDSQLHIIAPHYKLATYALEQLLSHEIVGLPQRLWGDGLSAKVIRHIQTMELEKYRRKKPT